MSTKKMINTTKDEKFERDKKLFEEVNKYLYDTPKRTKITMKWVSANCDVNRQEILKEVEKMIIRKPHLFNIHKGKVKKELSCCKVCEVLEELKEKIGREQDENERN